MNRKQITIVTTTKSEDKIMGIREAFLKYYPQEEFEIKIYSTKAESDVPAQPYQGAYNRISNTIKDYGESLIKQGVIVDYYVSCEAGIDDTNKVIINGKERSLFLSEQVTCIHSTKDNTYFFGKSSSWTIPEKDIEEIKDTNLDQYLRKRGCTGLHDVGNGRYITRRDAIREGTCAALASMCFKERGITVGQDQGEKDI